MDIFAYSEKTMSRGDGCYKLTRNPETGELYWALHYECEDVRLELDFSERERVHLTVDGKTYLRGRAFREEDLGN